MSDGVTADLPNGLDLRMRALFAEVRRDVAERLEGHTQSLENLIHSLGRPTSQISQLAWNSLPAVPHDASPDLEAMASMLTSGTNKSTSMPTTKRSKLSAHLSIVDQDYRSSKTTGSQDTSNLWNPIQHTPSHDADVKVTDGMTNMRENVLSAVNDTFMNRARGSGLIAEFEKKTRPCLARLKSLLQTPAAEYVTGFFILANAVFVAFQTDHNVKHPKEEDPEWCVVLDFLFCGIFILELGVRIIAFRVEFLSSKELRWNVFDLVVVISATFELTLNYFIINASDFQVDVVILRVIRVFRLARVLRIIRVVRVFRELRIMMLSVVATMRSLFWTILCLFLLTFVFGVMITQTVANILQSDNYEADTSYDDVILFFGTLPRCLLALFQGTTGGVDWREISSTLASMDSWATAAFICYICLIIFAVMNILTSVCVSQASKAAEEDFDFIVQEELRVQSSMESKLRTMFHKADTSNSGFLKWSQMQVRLLDPHVMTYFKSIGLEVWDLHTFFELMRTNAPEDDESDCGDPCVNIDQFVRGCVRLKGPAKNVDIVAMRHEFEMECGALRNMVRQMFQKLAFELKNAGSTTDSLRLSAAS